MSTATSQRTTAATDHGPRAVPATGGTETAPAGHVDPLRFLISYNARNLTKVVTEVGRATGAYWIDAVQRIAKPGDAARRSLLWLSAMADRREPAWHLANEVALSTPFALLRDFTAAEHRDDDVVPTLVLPPQAGHSSTVIDYSPQQSQLAMIRAAGLTKLYALDWRPATTATKNVTITDYLEVIDRSIRRMGGRANLVGDCQGGWLATIYAALHPERVNTLTLAGAPIDFHAGESIISASTKLMAGSMGMAPYKALVAAGGGNMPGSAVLSNFISIQPQSEVSRQLQLLENIDDATHVERYRVFEDWFKYTQDIPGAFYLWLVENLFWKNRLIDGTLQVDGRTVDMAAIDCPLLLLAGSTDHITPAPQLFAAAEKVSTPAKDVTYRTASAGHLGLFMGRDALRQEWPVLMESVYSHSVPGARAKAGGTGKGSRRRSSVRAVADPRDTPRVPAP
ncbi:MULTISPECIES: alpha/beta fold hydrolase [unclassified Pseudonocardia]|uniref:alpha/beta fold hydrolase n=2 Tax=unclassified Pseudonocardia TaxID=2619320 RepID=UPI0001FFEDB7|nr:alpha/beta fold hydrolase [Pseudonocardia sp. Ae707_Ps1]OLM18008.1 Polyhydroxyalkanoic acid synthase [Pseudonocardia sp. Ae707_Ps1]